MENFLINLPKDTLIYRSVNAKNNLNGHWFSYDIETIKLYNPTSIETYKLKKKLKVINLISHAFHIDYLDKINLKFTGNNYDGIDMRKIYALLPIGLPDFETQKIMLQRFNINLDNIIINDDMKMFLSCLDNKLRMSDYNIDRDFANIIQELYNTCDGFTQPLSIFNPLFKGNFHREIYIYNRDNIELINTEVIDHGGQPLHGGENKKESTTKAIVLPRIDFKKVNEDIYKSLEKYRNAPTIIPGYMNPPKNITRKNKIYRLH